VFSSYPLSLPAVKTIDDEIATRRAMKIHSLNITTAKNSLFNCALSGIFQTVLRSRGKIFRVGCATLKE
jgi:hypothetical protein